MLQPISSYFSGKVSGSAEESSRQEPAHVSQERLRNRPSSHSAPEHSRNSDAGLQRPSPPRPSADVEDLNAYLEVIELWLKWESCQESLTEMMYRQRSQGQRIEALLDECERIRFQASEASKRLVEARRNHD
jgi:hypothetical protein